MKILTYKIVGYTGVYNPETDKVEQQVSHTEVVVKNPNDEEIARAVDIAYNGEYTIVDDCKEEAVQPTAGERLAALEYAMLEMMGVSVND